MSSEEPSENGPGGRPATAGVPDGQETAGGPASRLRAARQRLLGQPPPGFGQIVSMTILFVLGIGTVAPVLPAFVSELGLSNTGAALLLSSFALGRAAFTLPAGPITDRFGFRAITIASAGVLAAAMTLAAVSGSLIALVAAQAVAGAASAQYTTTAMTTLMARTPGDAVGRLLSAYQGVLILVMSFAPTVGGLAAAGLGVKGPFIVSAVGAVVVLGFAATVMSVRDGPAQRAGQHADRVESNRVEWDRPESDRPELHEDPTTSRPARSALWPVLRSRPFVVSLLAGLASMWAIGAVRNTLVPLFGAAELGMSETAIGTVLTVGGLVTMATLLPAGRALDVVGRRAVVRVGMVVTAAAALGFVLVSQVWGLYLAIVALGLARGVVSPTPAVIVSDIAPAAVRGSALAVSRLGPNLGLAVGPLAAGAVSDAVGPRGGFLASGLFLLALAAVSLAMPETLRAGAVDDEPPAER